MPQRTEKTSPDAPPNCAVVSKVPFDQLYRRNVVAILRQRDAVAPRARAHLQNPRPLGQKRVDVAHGRDRFQLLAAALCQPRVLVIGAVNGVYNVNPLHSDTGFPWYVTR